MGERIPEIGFIEFYRIIGRKRKKIERRRERRIFERNGSIGGKHARVCEW
jgi:hypothetical protein